MFRFVIYGVATACLTFVYALRLAFHSTILCQYDSADNSTDPHYLTNPTYKVLSYSSVSIGLVIGLIPLSTFYHLGTRKIFFFYGFIGVSSTFLYPAADALGFLPAFIIRLLQGVPGAMYLWAVNSVSLEWAPRRETGQAVAILTCFYQLSPIVAAITSGEMCTSIGWEYTYYFLGLITAMLFGVFWFTYSENPRNSQYTSEEEADLINEGKFESKAVKRVAPLRALFTDPQVYLAWGMYFTFFLGSYVFLQFGPVYISLVLSYNIRSTGYAMSLPHLITLISKFAYGRILDKFCNLSQRFRLIIAYSTVEIASSVCLCMLLFTNSTLVALLVYIIFNSLHNLVVVVIMRHMQLIARQHSHVLANGNTFIVAVCVLSTSVLQYLVLNNSQEQWTAIFLGVAGSILVTVLLFAFCSTSKPRKWTEIEVIPLDQKE